MVRIEIRQRGEGDDLPRIDVHDGGRSGLRLEFFDALGEFVANRMGHLEVEGEGDGLQILGRQVEAEAVEGGEALSVDIFLDAGDALVVDVGEAENMGGDRAVRVDAPVLRQEADAGQAETEDFVLFLRRDVALDPDETLARAEPLAQLLRIEVRQDPASEGRRHRPCR